MHKSLRALISLSILTIGAGTLFYLKSTKPQAKKSSIGSSGTPVEITTIGETSTDVIVKARGAVMPSRRVTLGAEVGGKIVRISEALQPGGKFVAGTMIARIDPSDYQIAVQQQFAAIDSAEAQVAVEASRVAVAKREWEMFGNKDKGNKQLALREPQMRSATTQLKSAKSGLKRARLGVRRAIISAPFDGMVETRVVELGQIVGPGTPLLSFVGTKTYWVQVSIPMERLIWLSIPGIGGVAADAKGSEVTIKHQIGNELIQKNGRVLRLLAGVDPAGHMARILIEVDDPLGTEAAVTKAAAVVATEVPEQRQSRLPLLLGSYVEVEITGRRAENIVELQRSSLRGGDTVFVLKDDFTLEMRKVEVMWRRENTVLVSAGLKTGDKIVVSPLSAPVAGMKLRLPGMPSPHTEPKPNKTATKSPTSATAGKGK